MSVAIPREWPGWRRRLAGAGQAYGALLALAALVLLNVLFTPNFATPGNLWNVLLQVSTTALVAVGMTLVIATGGVDLSVGSVLAVASSVAVLCLGHGSAAAIAAGLAAAAALGAINGVLITRFSASPFIVTLAMQIAGRGLAQVLGTAGEGELVAADYTSFEYLGRGYVGPVPVPVLLAAAGVGLAVFVMRATVLGRYLVAVGGNEAAARLAGVPVGATRLTAYVASATLAGLAGLIDTARLGTTDPSNLGAGMEFSAIFAVVIGGTPLNGGRATVLGTVVGALILAVIGAAFNMLLIPFAWALVVQAAIILVAVYIQSPHAA